MPTLPALRLSLLLTTVATVVALAAAPVAEAMPGVRDPADRCTPAQREASLIADRDRVLGYVGHLRTLAGPDDLAALRLLGTYGTEAHGWVQYRDVGVTIVSLADTLRLIGMSVQGVTAGTIARETVVSGRPFALLYRARGQHADTGNPDVPHYPYDLVGWFYGGVYTPGVTPEQVGLCLYRNDWAFHERGEHSFPELDMNTMPPKEPYLGADPGALALALPPKPGFVHPRMWDVHIFLDPQGGAPRPAAFSPFGDIPGKEGGMMNAFPYPQWPDSPGVPVGPMPDMGH